MKKASNRLANERSPYLLQHSQNPVDWYPWGEEAFTRAKSEDRLIFLSIGYSSCHWCHVMERESFENEEIAEVLNENFISVKVDREELPEIDTLYMEFAQSLMGGQAGWPLNLFLTPDLHPIFATTYLPAKGEGGLMGFLPLLQNILEVWNSEEREKILAQAEKMVEALRDKEATYGEKISEREVVSKGIDQLFQLADPVYGGLMGSPKFPITPQLFLLSHHVKRTKDSRALFMIEKSLQGMYMGGIFDHLGGGFHRYSVDAEWFQPHFEKMVSENSLLTEVYLLGYLLTNNPLYKTVAISCQSYLMDRMCSQEGLFFTAQDADSDGFEGRYYLWSREEIDRCLGSESSLFCDVYSVIPEGNFEEGRNILFLLETPEKIAEEKGMQVSLIERRIDASKSILLAVRDLRSQPKCDTKILLGTNALQIGALVRLGQITFDRRYFEKAERIASYIKNNLFEGNRLLRQEPYEERRLLATLEEYAFLVRSLLLMAEADLGVEWLKWAIELSDLMVHKFKVEGGAFLSTDADEDYILLRKPLFLDGQEPSGNAIACANFMKLARITGLKSYLVIAEDILKAVKPLVESYPSAYAFHLANLEEFYDSDLKTVFLHMDDADEVDSYSELLWAKAPFLGSFFIIRNESSSLPYFVGYPRVNGMTTLYICTPKGCLSPVVGHEAIINAIQNL